MLWHGHILSVCVCIWFVVKSVKIKCIQRVFNCNCCKGTLNITYNGYCDAGGEYCQWWHVHFGSEDDRCDSGHLFVMWSIKDNKKKIIKSITLASGHVSEWGGGRVKSCLNRGENQSRRLLWLTARRWCFQWRCREQLSFSFCFLLPPSSITCPLGPSWCCRLLLNVSPNFPSISLARRSIAPSPTGHSFLSGRLVAAPLIFPLRNLQRQIKSFTCVIFNSCPSLSWAPHYSAVFCYLFSLCPQTHYMTGGTQAQKRLWAVNVKVQRSPGEGRDAVFAGSRCIRWQRVSKIALSLMATLTKASGPTLLICFPKGQGAPFQSALTFFLLSFWVMRFNCVKGERELLVQDFIPDVCCCSQ